MIPKDSIELTRWERVFRLWMLISFWMYISGAVFFLLGGAHIPAIINAISAKLLPLPLYPLPAHASEGAFWRVLGVSMMVMLTWVCRTIHSDVRKNGHLVVVVLLSKSCSTAVYLMLFLGHTYLAYLVGALTDGPIFLITLALWFQAAPADRFLNRKEEQILAAVGNALIPRGGAFAIGYEDLREESLAEARRLLAVQDPVTLIATRLALRAINWAPVLIGSRACTLCGMSPQEQSAFLMRLEDHRNVLARTLPAIAKIYAVVPFFNQPTAYRAVGYYPESPRKP